jgi:murein DD-endopeptidase MepM/ murein hydrolase activator NlpD
MKLPFDFGDIPLSGQNAFGGERKYDIHTGVDLFCDSGQEIRSIEDGIVVNVLLFTGGKESPWWNDTYAVMVEGKSGVILYGELETYLSIGKQVKKGDLIGKILTVLKHDKGKPMTMLHLELYEHGYRDAVWWHLNEKCPDGLVNPTNLLSLLPDDPK